MQPNFIPTKIEIGRSIIYLYIETQDNMLKNGLQLLVEDYFKTIKSRAYQEYLISFIDRKTEHAGCPNCRRPPSRDNNTHIINIILDENIVTIDGNNIPRTITIDNFHATFNQIIKNNKNVESYSYDNEVLCTQCQLKNLGRKSKVVLDMIMAGKNTRYISSILKIDEKTVSRHKRIIMQKMGVSNIQFLHKRFINC